MTTSTKKSVFQVLNSIDVTPHVEKKNNLTYLSWAWAWTEIKKNYPDANYTIYERETQYGPVNYFTDGKTCWVKTGVTIDGMEHIEELPVMDFRNRAIPLENITSFDVNKSIQRSLTKACARHGLGLYIYAGEDLPEEKKEENTRNLLTEAQAAAAQVSDRQGFARWWAKYPTLQQNTDFLSMARELGQKFPRTNK